MPPPDQDQNAFHKWVEDFSVVAAADRYRELLRPLNHLDIKCSARNVMEATVWLVCAVVTFCKMDGRDCEAFLKQQHYWPGNAKENKYCLTFDLSGPRKRSFGRILTDAKFSSIDLEDLFNFAWPMSQTAGFSEVYITRLDGKRIGTQERHRLYKVVAEDMYYGYSEEELSVDVIPTFFDDTVLINAAEND